MTNLFPELRELGDAIERAVATELAGRSRPRPRTRQKLLLTAAALLVAIPGLAYATITLISSDEVAAGLPAGTKMS